MAKKVVACTNCGSTSFVKKGTTPNNSARKFLCKFCGKSFSYRAEDLVGTAYEIENSNTTKTTPPLVIPNKKTTTPPTTNSSSKISDKTTTNITTKDTNGDDSIEYKTVNDIDLGKVKKDKNGNFLMRIGNKPPIPIGSSKEDLVAIVRKHGGSCTLKLGSDGVFILNVNTTTKGYI